MGIIIKTKAHYLTRFPIWLTVIVIAGLSPFIIGFTEAYISEITTGQPCHEGNCFWGAVPWIGIFVTLPLGAIALFVYLIIIIIDSYKLYIAKPK